MGRCIILDLVVLLTTFATISGTVLRNADECPLLRTSVPTCPLSDPEFSLFFPHPSDCHWFFHCSNGVAYCKKCPADLHWNSDKRTCDHAYRAGCNASSSTVTSQNVSTQLPSSPATTPAVTVVSTELPAVTAEQNTKCPDGSVPKCVGEGHFVFFPHPSDCHWFFHCSNGVAYCKKCPADLHWNSDKRTCDYAYRAGCNASSSTVTSKNVSTQLPSSPATTRAATVVSTERPAVTTEQNTKCPDGSVPKCNYPDQGYSVFFPHPNDIHWFFHCSNGVAYCKKCPADLQWDVQLETCVLPTQLDAEQEVRLPYQHEKQHNHLHFGQPSL